MTTPSTAGMEKSSHKKELTLSSLATYSTLFACWKLYAKARVVHISNEYVQIGNIYIWLCIARRSASRFGSLFPLLFAAALTLECVI